MKKLFLIGFCVAGMLFTSLPDLCAEEITLTSCNWEPYVGEELPDYGFSSELLSTVFQQAGYRPNIKILPWNRSVHLLRVGKADVAYSAYYSDERAQEFALSEPYIESGVSLCALKELELDYQGVDDLYPYSIGVVRGYVNPPEFDNDEYLRKDEAPADLNNLRKLLHGRVDMIVIDKFVALHLLNNSPEFAEKKGLVRCFDPGWQVMPVHAMFSKAVPGYEKKVADFNAGLHRIKADGSYARILEKHGVLAAE